jgi:uncharacterized protein YbjQ (UPF0145 family)
MGIHRSRSGAPEWCVVVTTDDLPGYEICQVYGYVMGVVVRTQNPFSEGLKALDGGVNPRRVKVMTNWRQQAIDAMIEEAKKRGANAIIGMRFDHRVLTEFWTEICAYGTAILAAPVPSKAEQSGQGAGASGSPTPPTEAAATAPRAAG